MIECIGKETEIHGKKHWMTILNKEVLLESFRALRAPVCGNARDSIAHAMDVITRSVPLTVRSSFSAWRSSYGPCVPGVCRNFSWRVCQFCGPSGPWAFVGIQKCIFIVLTQQLNACLLACVLMRAKITEFGSTFL